jgi:hypothetical protein
MLGVSRESADAAASGIRSSGGRRPRQRRESMKRVTRAALCITATAISALTFAATSAADPDMHLQSEIDAARSEAGCPPLQLDPVLNDLSRRIVGETDSYVKHAARALPTTNEIDLIPTGSGGLLKAMRQSGYNTQVARLLSGYGDYNEGGNQADDLEKRAIKDLILEGLAFDTFTDCRYTKYGFDIISDNSSQGWPSTPPRAFSVAAAVLAGDREAPRG